VAVQEHHALEPGVDEAGSGLEEVGAERGGRDGRRAGVREKRVRDAVRNGRRDQRVEAGRQLVRHRLGNERVGAERDRAVRFHGSDRDDDQVGSRGHALAELLPGEIADVQAHL